jgi:hypothetical protein
VNEINPDKLAHIYWIGGSPCSGKSSIATMIAAKYGWGYYSCDEAFYRHLKLIDASAQPVFSRVMGLSQEELWMRPVERQLRDELQIYHEEFPFILADLLALDPTQPVIAEGAALRAELVQPLLLDAQHYIAIVPTPQFQLEHYSKRDWIQEHLSACSDPQQAFRNWMERDIRFARHVHADADARGLKCMVVDGGTTIEQNQVEVERWFGRVV